MKTTNLKSLKNTEFYKEYKTENTALKTKMKYMEICELF